MKAKEDEQQLKLLKEQYLDFDDDDDGRRLKISKGTKQSQAFRAGQAKSVLFSFFFRTIR